MWLFKTSGYLESGFWIVIMTSAHDKLSWFQLYAGLEERLFAVDVSTGMPFP
jgi:hypothetical protein